MNTRNNHQGQSANRATRRAGKKATPAKAMPSPLLAALWARHYKSLDLDGMFRLSTVKADLAPIPELEDDFIF